ncbi:MAG TPA: RNA polymerase sigma factor [Bacteroidales bacterium]|nr:RNA polymerase sigma factor [Bacteroidales bacterium]
MIDLKLIEQCRQGNIESFRKVIEASSPFAYSVAFKMLGDEDLAKDVVQETMITIWKKIGHIRTAQVYKTWLYRIVVNKCYDELRKARRRPEVLAAESTWVRLSDTISENGADEFTDSELAVIISKLTERLSPRQKAVFVLSELEEMTSDEIAGITGMSKTSIKANLYHARKSFREMLGKYL